MSTIIMIGNPGSGKSSLLSSLVGGSAAFPSGPSINAGKTTELLQVVHNGNTYVDTPRLSDFMLHTEIKKWFDRGGKFKIFFVVTLESGRVKPDDVATINLVLDSIPHIGPNYSIIINKLPRSIITLLNESAESREDLADCLAPPNLAATRSIFYLPLIPELMDEIDKRIQPSPDLLSFISNAPEVNTSRSTQSGQFDEIVAELRQEIAKLQQERFDFQKNQRGKQQVGEDHQIKEYATAEEIQRLREDNTKLKLATADYEVTVGKLNNLLEVKMKENSALNQRIVDLEVEVNTLKGRLRIKKDKAKELAEDKAEFQQALAEVDKKGFFSFLIYPKSSGSPKQHKQKTIIMIGNPGAGKSTLLTSLMEGKQRFSSGISIGKGNTKVLQQVEHNGITYIDTPGLSDVQLREQAAESIKEALQKSGNYRVFFVVTLESGRVKPDDVNTIKLVLTAAPQITDNKYSILINKLTKRVEDLLLVEQNREELAVCLTPPSIGISTRSIYFVSWKPEWEDKNDQWSKLSPEVLRFIDSAPSIVITAKKVKDISTERYDEQLKHLTKEIQHLQGDNIKMRKAIVKRQKRLAKTEQPLFSWSVKTP